MLDELSRLEERNNRHRFVTLLRVLVCLYFQLITNNSNQEERATKSPSTYLFLSLRCVKHHVALERSKISLF